MNRFVRGWLGRHPSALSAVEVHRTACIVTHPPAGERANCALVNPANAELVGTQFTPQECWTILHGDPTTGRWDQNFATYPFQAIDGLVTEFGGDRLASKLQALPADSRGRRCPVGTAVVTPAFGELTELYASLIHAAPPAYRLLEPSVWEQELRATYHAAIDAANRAGFASIALPLLGAGAKGAPLKDAMRVAAQAIVDWRPSEAAADEQSPTPVVRFGVQDSSTAHALIAELESAMDRDAHLGGAHTFELVASSPRDERWALS